MEKGRGYGNEHRLAVSLRQEKTHKANSKTEGGRGYQGCLQSQPGHLLLPRQFSSLSKDDLAISDILIAPEN